MPPNGPVTARFATSIHESAHACIALSFGLPVKRLSISADGLEGECIFGSGAPREHLVATFMAGILGQRMICPFASIDIACADIKEADRHIAGMELKELVAKTKLR